MTKLCSVDGCMKEITKYKQLCTMHYTRLYKHNTTELVTRKNLQCLECGKLPYSKKYQLCFYHYQLKRKQDGLFEKNQCTIDGCDKKSRYRGLCDTHYKRQHDYDYAGLLNDPNRARCTIESCDRPMYAKGLCRRHYDQQCYQKKAKRDLNTRIMTATNFPICLAFTLKSEGGYSDNPADPGGATMEGITLSTYRDWEHDQTLTAEDLKQITSEEVSSIYQANYWTSTLCDSLPPGVDLMCFDMSVNAGTSRSVKLLQATVGSSIDGTMGPNTLANVAKIDATMLINQLAIHQSAFYKSLATFPTFGNGWLSRVHARQQMALTLATEAPAPSLPSTPAQHLGPSDNPWTGFYETLVSLL